MNERRGFRFLAKDGTWQHADSFEQAIYALRHFRSWIEVLSSEPIDPDAPCVGAFMKHGWCTQHPELYDPDYVECKAYVIARIGRA